MDHAIQQQDHIYDRYVALSSFHPSLINSMVQPDSTFFHLCAVFLSYLPHRWQSARVLGDVPPLVQTQPADNIHSFCTRSKFIVYLFPPVLCLDHKYNTTNPETSNMQKPTIRIIGASGGSETNSISSNIRQSFSTSFATAT